MEIKRQIIEQLKEWKENPHRKPLVLQGARQVGKSWAMKQFGTECYSNVIYINFDLQPELKSEFAYTKEPARLISRLEMIFGQKIQAGSTLIIIDEIQECNDALNCLKYFYENAPDYHIICAGSLLGVALGRSGASFPVGKVDFLTLYPISFSEFLEASDAQLHNAWQQISLPEPIPEIIHNRLIDYYNRFLALGGMPEAVSTYLDTQDWQEVDRVLENILNAYSLDFSKHINNKDIPRVFQLWGNIQDQLARENKKFRFADIQSGARAREYESAIEWLCLSGLTHRVTMVETPRLPLSAYKKSSAFKLYLNDVGLLRTKFRLTPSAAIIGDKLLTEFKGVLSENFILCSLIRQFGKDIFYWSSGNTAEIEFVIQLKNNIIPIEVKSENNIKAKSLSEYRKTYQPPLAIRFSTRNLKQDNNLINIPLYLVDKMQDPELSINQALEDYRRKTGRAIVSPLNATRFFEAQKDSEAIEDKTK